MHELSVLTYLLEAVEEQARQVGASRVLAINLVMGDRASIVEVSEPIAGLALLPAEF